MIALMLTASVAMLPADLPEPEGLQPNIRFWERIYGEWSSGQVVFHDREHLGVVYEVFELGELRVHPQPGDPAKRSARREERRDLIERRKEEIVAGLELLSKLELEGNLRAEALDDSVAALYRAAVTGGMQEFEGAPDRLRWQYGLADLSYQGLKRYDRYSNIVAETFRSRGVPEELLALAFVESLFEPSAVSWAGAAGMFQFMPATGREYGLLRGSGFDMRRDPVLAADAAARMLRRNYERLGNWPLALTGYNHGPNGVARAVREVGSRDLMDLIERYEARRWGFASKNFYAQVMAARRVMTRRHEYFGDWVPAPPIEMSGVKLKGSLPATSLVLRGCLDRATLLDYNPAVFESALDQGHRLPSGLVIWAPSTMSENLASCATEALRESIGSILALTEYRVGRGDTLSHIAQRHMVSVKELIELNGLSQDGLIRVGQVLRLPERSPGTGKAHPVTVGTPSG